MAPSLLRHAAMVCANAHRGLPQSFANGRSVAMPDGAARQRVAARAQHFAAVAARLDGRGGTTDWTGLRAARILPAAVPTTGNLTILEDDPYWRAEPLSQRLSAAGGAGQ